MRFYYDEIEETNKKFTEDEYYLVFVLGYDLLHEDIMQCVEHACDIVFDTMAEIIELFLNSEENRNLALSTYDALRKFLSNNKLQIDTILYNNLGGKYPYLPNE
jgi:hypothetical protein|nr:MAG TPA: hypothetical protein [Caudoviricetes sp.]